MVGLVKPFDQSCRLSKRGRLVSIAKKKKICRLRYAKQCMFCECKIACFLLLFLFKNHSSSKVRRFIVCRWFTAAKAKTIRNKRKGTKSNAIRLYLVVILLNLHPFLCQLLLSLNENTRTHKWTWLTSVQCHIFQHNNFSTMNNSW